VRVGWNGEPVRVKGKKDGEKGVDVRLNKGAVVDEIRRLGGELVAGIEVRE
jgi:U3 small nucleolar RNA-associated protein 22